MRLCLPLLLFSACATPAMVTDLDPRAAQSSVFSASRSSADDSAREAPEATDSEPPRPTKASGRRVRPFHISLRRGRKRIDNLRLIEVDPQNPERMWISRDARKVLRGFLGDPRHKRVKRLPERLLWYLYFTAQEFDTPLTVISAYRSKERRSSRHAHMRAVDFRVPGHSPRKVWDYLKRFDDVGLGWYPKSKFVHLDVRKRSAYWIDDSGPGQRSRYRKGVSQARPKTPRHR